MIFFLVLSRVWQGCMKIDAANLRMLDSEKNDVCHSPVDLINVTLMELKTRSLRLEIAVS